MAVVVCGFVLYVVTCYELFCVARSRSSPIRRKMPQDAAKCRKYHELAISLYGTKYLGGGAKTPCPLFWAVENNRGPKLRGHGPLSPLTTLFLVSSRG